jgi:hypothetical protein
LWVILLELIVFRCLALQFNFDYHTTLLNVLWALGWAMIVLSVDAATLEKVFVLARARPDGRFCHSPDHQCLWRPYSMRYTGIPGIYRTPTLDRRSPCTLPAVSLVRRREAAAQRSPTQLFVN